MKLSVSDILAVVALAVGVVLLLALVFGLAPRDVLTGIVAGLLAGWGLGKYRAGRQQR